MTTSYHKQVQRHLLALGGEARNIRKVYNDKRPRHIFDPTSKASFLYYPDATFETRTGNFYLFEVLDSEAKAQSQVVAHVVEALLTSHVLRAIFIVKSQAEADMVENIYTVISKNLKDRSAGKMPERVRFGVVVISPGDALSLAKVRAILAEASADLGIQLKPSAGRKPAKRRKDIRR